MRKSRAKSQHSPANSQPKTRGTRPIPVLFSLLFDLFLCNTSITRPRSIKSIIDQRITTTTTQRFLDTFPLCGIMQTCSPPNVFGPHFGHYRTLQRQSSIVDETFYVSYEMVASGTRSHSCSCAIDLTSVDMKNKGCRPNKDVKTVATLDNLRQTHSPRDMEGSAQLQQIGDERATNSV